MTRTAGQTARAAVAPRVVFFSAHFFPSKRRAGFHHLATAFADLGWDVLFVTTGISWLSYAVRDARLQQGARAHARGIVSVAPSIWSHVWFTPWHPVNMRSDFLNAITMPWFTRYGGLPRARDLRAWLGSASLVVVESAPVIMALEVLRAASPRAKFVYRVSDDLRLLRPHPAVVQAEQRVVSLFDLVSSPTAHIHALFAALPSARLQMHGIQKALLDEPHPDPYADQGFDANAVFVGASFLDEDFLERAARSFPTIGFHVIGPFDRRVKRRNVVHYGELAFLDTIRYLQHANVGLQTRVHSPSAESLVDSLKVLQYSYLGLPILAPDFMRTGRPNFHHYRPGDDESIRAAMDAALSAGRKRHWGAGISSWSELARDLAAVSGHDLPTA